MILVGQGTITPTGFIQYWRGKSTETKPIAGVGEGSVFYVYDTDPVKYFCFDGSEWYECHIPSGGGSVDGLDPNIVVVTDADGKVVSSEISTTILGYLSGVTSNIQTQLNTIDAIAKGANQAVCYNDYSSMVSAINALAKTKFKIGQNIMIITLDVPDIWVSEIMSTSVPYVYTSDAEIISALKTTGYIQCGYYKLSTLETQKVDLTNYVTNDALDTELNTKAVRVDKAQSFTATQKSRARSNIGAAPDTTVVFNAEYDDGTTGTLTIYGTLT